MWYNINFNQLLKKQILKIFLSSDVLVLGQIILTPLEKLHYDWKIYRSDNIEKLKYNSQICFLRKALNDKFDVDQRRIYIGDTLDIDQDYIYTIPENSITYLGTMYLQEDFNYVDASVDFLVYVPQLIIDNNIHELDALIEFYRLASKRYKILPI